MLSLSIHKHSRPLRWFMALIYFISVLEFSAYWLCTCCILNIPEYFISLFWGNCKWCCDFNFGSARLLLVCGNVIDFVLIWRPLILLNLLFQDDFGRWLGILCIDGHVTCKWRQFYFFLSNSYAFYLFLFLASLQWLEFPVVHWIRLVKVDVSHSCLVADVTDRESLWSFGIKYDVSSRMFYCLFVFVLWMLFVKWRVAPLCSQFFGHFYHEWWWLLSDASKSNNLRMFG